MKTAKPAILEGNLQLQLRQLENQHPDKIRIGAVGQLRPVTEIGVDGVDHINIHRMSKSDLGRLLAFEKDLRFWNNHFGEFLSVTGFWRWLTSKDRDPKLRSRKGIEIISDKEVYKNYRIVKNWEAIILDCCYQRVLQYDVLVKALFDIDLPFDCYYHYRRVDGPMMRIKHAWWIVTGFEEIRKAIRENRKPDFSFIINGDLTMEEIYAELPQCLEHIPTPQPKAAPAKKVKTPPPPPNPNKKKKPKALPKTEDAEASVDNTPPEVTELSVNDHSIDDCDPPIVDFVDAEIKTLLSLENKSGVEEVSEETPVTDAEAT